MNFLYMLSYFFAGVFLANAVPHYVLGTTGRRFPSPFAVPPGKGESPPLLNVIWGFANAVVGLLLIQPGNFNLGINLPTLIFMVGGLLMSIFLAKHFGELYSPVQ